MAQGHPLVGSTWRGPIFPELGFDHETLRPRLQSLGWIGLQERPDLVGAGWKRPTFVVMLVPVGLEHELLARSQRLQFENILDDLALRPSPELLTVGTAHDEVVGGLTA